MTDNDFVKEAEKWRKLPTPTWFIGLKEIEQPTINVILR